MKRYEEYKAVDLPWLAEIPKHWDFLYLSQVSAEKKNRNTNNLEQNVLSLSYGNIVKKKDINFGLTPKDYATYQIVEKDDIILRLTDLQNDKRSLRTGYVPMRGIITSAYVCLQPNINSKFLHYTLHSFDTIKVFYGMGSGVRQSMGFREIKPLLIPTPSNGEQEQIVKFLDWKVSKINKYIKAKKRQIELLREEIEKLCLGGENIHSTKIESWEDYFPVEWRKALGKRIFEEQKNKNCENEELLAVTQDRGVVYKKDCEANYVKPTGDFSNQKLVCPRNFVISLRSFQGGIEYSICRGLVSPAYNVFKLKPQYESIKLEQYYRFLFKSPAFIQLLKGIGGGIRDGKNISFTDFSQFVLPIPPYEIIEKVYSLSLIYDTLLSNFRKQNILLLEYQKKFISDVVTGKVDVRDIEVPDNYEIEEPVIGDTDDEEEVDNN